MAESRTVQKVENAVLPYAIWLGMLIELGYLGWNLFELYQKYCAQHREDKKRGYSRTFREKMEVSTRRRKRNTPAAQTSPEPTCTKKDSGSSRGGNKEKERSPRSSNSNVTRQIDTCEPSSSPDCIYPSLIELPEDDEVGVLCDSRLDTSRAMDRVRAKAGANNSYPQIVELSEDDLEVPLEFRSQTAINRN